MKLLALQKQLNRWELEILQLPITINYEQKVSLVRGLHKNTLCYSVSDRDETFKVLKNMLLSDRITKEDLVHLTEVCPVMLVCLAKAAYFSGLSASGIPRALLTRVPKGVFHINDLLPALIAVLNAKQGGL